MTNFQGFMHLCNLHRQMTAIVIAVHKNAQKDKAGPATASARNTSGRPAISRFEIYRPSLHSYQRFSTLHPQRSVSKLHLQATSILTNRGKKASLKCLWLHRRAQRNLQCIRPRRGATSPTSCLSTSRFVDSVARGASLPQTIYAIAFMISSLPFRSLRTACLTSPLMP
jgi:hypothetical protein